MDLISLLKKSRSIRRFDESRQIDSQVLKELVNATRFAPSGANKQPLKYIMVSKPEASALLFPSTAWAGYLSDWVGPSQGERPVAYIIIVGDSHLSASFHTDLGIAAQTIMLAAREKEIAGCMIASIKKDEIRENFNISEQYEILLVLALGYPAEDVVIEEIVAGDVKYWRDDEGRHHVPKRTLSEIVINEI